ARASSNLDHRCDLWALATIAYEALSSGLPIEGDDADEVLENLCRGRIVPFRQQMAGMPAALDAFFARAFASAMDAGFESAGELAVAFAKAAKDDGDMNAGGAAGTTSDASPPARVASFVDALERGVASEQAGSGVTSDIERDALVLILLSPEER